MGHDTSARHDAGGTHREEPSESLIDDHNDTENDSREGSDTKLQEPLVVGIANRSHDPENVAHRKHPQRMHRKTLLLIFGKHPGNI